ncbi:M48 family metallopeptidase [Aeoliella sp. SH292]|uniref:M48 family metallopeptidase n=1 Tax=Aeoliella sp. SH292 TaxID=3454464 RepID=UPI003F97A293
MATNFFERQTSARRNTVWLIAMFVVATIGIVATTFIVAAIAVTQLDNGHSSLSGGGEPYPWEIPVLAAGGSLALVVGGSLFKVTALRMGGGASVADQLGGKLVLSSATGRDEQRLLNVVEEMAIASGVPVPPVYMMEEPGINAFAAGYSSGDAVLGVTRGAVQQLSREELQGVIAHEFSHVLNGDMRMSIRMMGILYGILLLGLMGQMLFRSIAFSGRSSNRDRNQGILVILAIGVALIVIGYLGTFIGGLIKAAISRQREYLADASAVQFTRNPGGIGGALKRIGGTVSGSRLKAPAAGEASHMFFAQGVFEGFSGLMATHPPLAKRILAIEPTWDGQYPQGPAETTGYKGRAGMSGLVGATDPLRAAALSPAAMMVDPAVVDEAIEQVGAPEKAHRDYAAQLLADLPPQIRDAVREPFGARAVIYCLLLDPRSEIRQKQIAALRQTADPAVLSVASQLQAAIAELDPRVRVPVVELAMPALRTLSRSQFDVFSKCLNALIAADNSLGLFEWTLGRMVDRHLAPQYEGHRRVATRYYGLQRLGGECSMLLSTIAHVGHNPEAAELAFAAAKPLLPEVQLQFLSREECGLHQLRGTLDTIATATAPLRGRVLDACAEVICADGTVKLAEAELLRGIADLLDCPMPPLLAGQSVAPSGAFRKDPFPESQS